MAIIRPVSGRVRRSIWPSSALQLTLHQDLVAGDARVYAYVAEAVVVVEADGVLVRDGDVEAYGAALFAEEVGRGHAYELHAQVVPRYSGLRWHRLIQPQLSSLPRLGCRSSTAMGSSPESTLSRLSESLAAWLRALEVDAAHEPGVRAVRGVQESR